MKFKKIFAVFLLLLSIFTPYAFSFGPSDDTIYEGIDVSYYQGDINYEDVKNSGIDIVYIRASEGTTYIDPYFKDNYEKAKGNGLKVGFYHYVCARNIEEAKNEARFFADVIKGTNPDCKLCMDFESFGNLSNYEINEISKTFLETLEEITNKECIIYSDAYNAKETFSEELAKEYAIWVADYFVNEPESNNKWPYWVGFQYTDRGKIEGIYDNVDRDKFTSGVLLNDTSEIKANTPNISSNKVKSNMKTITVTWGETLSGIAHEYNTSYMYLAKINGIKDPNLIYVGQKIEVPTNSNNELHETNHILYSVKRGNTLTLISQMYGVTIEDIATLNHIKNPNLIYTGQVLRIPIK